ncbi:zinc finger protein GLIS2-like [Synchiropus splendidus]|uniref:zinc finger protein GLIS2-like n=1 Tax=Synchiropus splendidus TaxID=270530 RepID=UPI00237D3683|nr:zinc finger protein GLIS2-like [Synchiropus splendidus]XP_053711346.1 zinc finger protein GLIS2-like [Synchiropus splendidus]XP_053711347.1 zinc finger protein GLIS2-like [Synchiropus splendidus]
MFSADEPLDLKLPSGRIQTDNPVRLRRRMSSICAPLCSTRPRLMYTTFPSPPSSPDSLSPSRERPRSCFTPPAMDLSLSPSSRHTSSLSPAPPSPSPSLPASPLESPQSSSSPQPHLFSRELSCYRGVEREASHQGFPFFLPISSSQRGYNFPPSMFVGANREKEDSPEPSTDVHLGSQLVCRWVKCRLQFDSLQDLVDHINEYHVKPEKDSGYHCQWEGCARNGRGFNARYKMLIHIRTHTNEKPHHCPTCDKSFSRLENLKIHTRSHTGEKPYICPYEGCSKRYSNSSDRFKHTRTHYVDKPYYCKMAGCLKRYTDPSSLRKHIKAHGHFVAPEQASPGRMQAGPLEHPGELAPVGAPHIIIPGSATLLGGLGTSLSLSAFCHARALNHHRASLFPMGAGIGPLGLADSPFFHLGASLLGLDGLKRMVGKEVAGEGGEVKAEVLNLSSGVGPRHRDPLSWVVVPPRALLLKPAVAS